jgi:hypothetical protein
VGDFNMPTIDWDTWNGKTDRDSNFIWILQKNWKGIETDEKKIWGIEVICNHRKSE